MDDSRLAEIAHLSIEEQVRLLEEDLGRAAARLAAAMPSSWPDQRRWAEVAAHLVPGGHLRLLPPPATPSADPVNTSAARPAQRLRGRGAQLI